MLKKQAKKYPRTLNAGFTLIEILLVVVIISALAAMVVPRLSGRSEQAKEAIAKADVQVNIATALKLYELDNGKYPSTDQGLSALINKPGMGSVPSNWNGPYVEAKNIVDPWGQQYLYKCPGNRGVDYDLYSLGKTGLDDESNITNW